VDVEFASCSAVLRSCNIWINYRGESAAQEQKPAPCKARPVPWRKQLPAVDIDSFLIDYVFFKMGANNGKQYGSEGTLSVASTSGVFE
jgi:hypothetical protein